MRIAGFTANGEVRLVDTDGRFIGHGELHLVDAIPSILEPGDQHDLELRVTWVANRPSLDDELRGLLG